LPFHLNGSAQSFATVRFGAELKNRNQNNHCRVPQSSTGDCVDDAMPRRDLA
jgi:hypothetical protein